MNINRNIINIACWSIGQHAIKNMLPAIAQCKDVNLSGIYTRNKVRYLEQCKLYNCELYIEETDLLNDSSIDAVYLSSPTGVHAEQISKCLDAGKSVLVEKTALPSLRETSELIAKAEEKGLVIMEAFMYRFHKQFQHLKELLDSKKYGEVIKLDCEFGFPHLNKDDIRYNKHLCGGALYDAGAYTLSAARNLLGNKGNIVWSKMIQPNEFEVDILGYAAFVSKNKVANCVWGFGSSYSNKIRIWCEGAHILCDRAFSKTPDYSATIVIEQNGSAVDTILIGCDNHFVNMLTYFNQQVLLKSEQTENNELLTQAQVIDKVKFLGGNDD
jgi:NDP-hexose-3-ketoreductase